LLQTDYTFGPDLHSDPFHIDIVHTHLTHQLSNIFPELCDEIVSTFDDIIPPTDDWTPVPVAKLMATIVARISNRVFVGAPLCRDPEYLKIAVDHTEEVSNSRNILLLFPDILKPIAARFITQSQRTITRAAGILGPTIHDRTQQIQRCGAGWEDKPNDMLTAVIEGALKRGLDVNAIARIMLITNFSAIHTSANAITHALYHLAASPEFVQPLREEAEAIIREEGWSKAAMSKLRKMDSFLKESQRLNGFNAISIMRLARTPLTLSDGTYIPKGTVVAAAATPTHTDDENYTNPEVFDPFRFSDIRGEDGQGTKHQFVHTSVDYLPFGHGKRACPGRFFAANQLKAMLAHIVLNYDVKFEKEGVRPANEWFALTIEPCPSSKVLFRKRLA